MFEGLICLAGREEARSHHTRTSQGQSSDRLAPRLSARITRINNNVLTSSTRGWIGGARARQKYRDLAHHPLQIRGPDRWNTGSASTFTVQSSHSTSPPSTVPVGVLLSSNCLPKSPPHTSSRDEESSTWSHFVRHWSMRIALNALQASPAAFLRRRRRNRVHAFTRIPRSHAAMTTGVFRVRMSFSAIKDNCCAQPFLTSQSRPPHAIPCSPRGLTRPSCAY